MGRLRWPPDTTTTFVVSGPRPGVGAIALLDVEMEVGLEERVVVVGTRAQPRSVTESQVPIDAIPFQDVASQGRSARRGTGHLDHPDHRPAAGGGAARRRLGAVRLGRHRRGAQRLDTPRDFDPGLYQQEEVNLNFDVSYAASDMVNFAAGTEWRDEKFTTPTRR